MRDVVDYESLFDCVHCGLCLEACPTYILKRREMDSPRGRIYQMKALAEGRLDADAEVVRHLDLCLGCRGCETACPSGVHYGALIEQTRGWLEENYRRSLADRLLRWIIGELFPYPARLRLALAPLRMTESAGLRGILHRISLLCCANGSSCCRYQPAAVGASSSGSRCSLGSVAVHRGCVAQVVADSANRSAENLLARAGYKVASLPRTVCCGALDLHSGNRKRAFEFSRATIRSIKESDVDFVVSTASGCSTAMAEYGELFKDDPELVPRAREVAARVKELSTLLMRARNNFQAP